MLNNYDSNSKGKQLLLFTILFLFFIQLLSSLIESIYVLDLLNTILDEKALGSLFLFSPLLLFFNKARGKGILSISAFILIVSRIISPFLTLSSRIIVSGIGVASYLVFFIVYLERMDKNEHPETDVFFGTAISLAIIISILLRVLGSSRDISLNGGGIIIGLVLGLIALGILFLCRNDSINRRSESGGEVFSIIGLTAVITLVYFLFQSPGIISRWSGISFYLVIILSSIVFSIYFVTASFWQKIIHINNGKRPYVLIIWNILFLIALLFTILLSRVSFPPNPEAPSVTVNQLPFYYHIPTIVMIILSPVIFVNANLYRYRISCQALSSKKVSLAYTLGTFILLILIFILIFTNIWSYVRPVSQIFRNQFYLPFLLACIQMILPLIFLKKGDEGNVDEKISERKRSNVKNICLLFPLVTICSVLFISSAPGPVEDGLKEIKVMTYNCQQGVDMNGNLALDQQLDFIRSVNPDIVVLQESDSPRISRGNVDLVRFFQNGLDYYSYFGPSTISGTFGTAILSRFPLENQRTVYTYSSDDEIGTAIAEISFGEKRVGIFCVHPYGDKNANTAFSNMVIETASLYDNYIVMGDFNMKEYEETLRTIADSMNDTWRVLNPIKRVPLEELEAKAKLEKVSYAGGAPSLNSRIDYIFVSDSFRVLDSRYIPPEDAYSDHPAHIAELRLE